MKNGISTALSAGVGFTHRYSDGLEKSYSVYNDVRLWEADRLVRPLWDDESFSCHSVEDTLLIVTILLLVLGQIRGNICPSMIEGEGERTSRFTERRTECKIFFKPFKTISCHYDPEWQRMVLGLMYAIR
jgi:hypothetical protein